ncbi:MAG: hypothetical protein ACR2IV_00660 [Bryobacteraceae bacterium]
MPTRREVLFNILSAPLAAAALVQHPLEPVSTLPEIIPEPHCLSEESANGFRLLLSRNRLASRAVSPKVIIVPASRQLSSATGRELLRYAVGGAWLILESGLSFMPREEAIRQIQLVRDVFGLEVRTPLANGGTYIEYTWPLRRFVRDFSMFTPVECSRTERIAELGGVTVCARRPVGKGGIIFLGSMLGPGLLAEEREAHELGSAMLHSIRKQSDL